MDNEKKKALQELLKILSEHPEVADLIEIKIRPSKLIQGTGKPKK